MSLLLGSLALVGLLIYSAFVAGVIYGNCRGYREGVAHRVEHVRTRSDLA